LPPIGLLGNSLTTPERDDAQQPTSRGFVCIPKNDRLCAGELLAVWPVNMQVAFAGRDEVKRVSEGQTSKNGYLI
jgi:hypothetical protein